MSARPATSESASAAPSASAITPLPEQTSLATADILRSMMDDLTAKVTSSVSTVFDDKFDDLAAQVRSISTRLANVEQPRASTPVASTEPVATGTHAVFPGATGGNAVPITPTSRHFSPSSGGVRDSARDTWNNLSYSEQSMARAHFAGLPTGTTSVLPSSQGISRSGTEQSPPAGRPLHCKTDELPKFDGNARNLDRFISRVSDLVRSNPDRAWDIAVKSALPRVFTGAAAAWHETLPTEVVVGHQSVADVFEALRKAFPSNLGTLRKEAHARVWEPTKEWSTSYAYDKLALIRHAYGSTSADRLPIEVAEIIDGLVDTIRPMVRLSSSPTMDELQRELVQWEPIWRAIHKVQLTDETSGSVSGQTGPSGSSTVTAPARKQAVATATSGSGGRPPAAPSAPPAPSAPTADPRRYDPSRVVEASGDLQRGYRRNDGSLMRLRRPCGRCGEQHFDFEHVYLKEGAKVFPIISFEAYDEEVVSTESDFA